MKPALRLVETPRRRDSNRRQTDRGQSSVPADRLAAAKGKKRPAGPTMRAQVVAPFGLGMLALVGAVAVAAAVGDRLGFSLEGSVIVATAVFVPLLMIWGGSILDDAAVKPLRSMRNAMEELEEGNYDARASVEGPREMHELANGFNRMVTIVSHQRDRLRELA